MNKINSLYKILATHDDVVNQKMSTEQWRLIITNCLIDFYSIEEKSQLDNIVISKLKGLRELYNDITHKEVKSIILRLTNKISKEENR